MRVGQPLVLECRGVRPRRRILGALRVAQPAQPRPPAVEQQPLRRLLQQLVPVRRQPAVDIVRRVLALQRPRSLAIRIRRRAVFGAARRVREPGLLECRRVGLRRRVLGALARAEQRQPRRVRPDRQALCGLLHGLARLL